MAAHRNPRGRAAGALVVMAFGCMVASLGAWHLAKLRQTHVYDEVLYRGSPQTLLLWLASLDFHAPTSAERIEITVINGLTSGRWILQSYSPGSSLKTPLPGTEITARFATNGDLSGSGGCNNYSGGFIAFDQTLRMRNISSSQVFCSAPEGIMEQEGEILALMNHSSRMAINAGQLEIFDGSGKRIMVFVNG